MNSGIHVIRSKVAHSVIDPLKRKVEGQLPHLLDQAGSTVGVLGLALEQVVDLRLLGEIESDTFAAKKTQLRDRGARLNRNADLAVKAFELSQILRRW